MFKNAMPVLSVLAGALLWRYVPIWAPVVKPQALVFLYLGCAAGGVTLKSAQVSTRWIELGKIFAYGFISMAFWKSLGAFGHLFEASYRVFLRAYQYYPVEQAVIKTFILINDKMISQNSGYMVWLVVSVLCLLPLLMLWKLLVLVPTRRLILDRAYRVKEGPWNAGYLEKSKENELKSNKTGLPLGVPLNENGDKGAILRHVPQPEKGWLGGHHVVISGSQGGKGVSCVLPAILDHQGPVAVLDIKGELFSMTRRARQAMGREVIVLNPMGVVEPSSAKWNPLDFIRAEEFERDARTIIEGILEPETHANKHFYKMASDILMISLEYMLTTRSREEFTLPQLYDFVCGPQFIDTLKRWKLQETLLDGRAAQTANVILSAGDEERGSMLTTLQKNLSWIASTKNREFLSESTFSFEDLLENKIDVFCVVPLDMIETLSGFLRLFTNVTLGTVLRQSGQKNPKEKVLLLLDEFPRLGAMRQLLNIVTVAAGAGIEAFMVAQDKASIEAVWGKEADVIFGSSATVRVFNLGRADVTTANWAASLLGHKTVVTRTNAAREYGEFLHGAGSESVSQLKEQLLSPSEIQELGHMKMLCFLRGQKPLLMNRIISYAHPQYHDRLDRNPTLLTTTKEAA